MKIIPRKGFILVSTQEIVQEKKVGSLILPGEEKKKTYLRVESDGELYHTGDCVFPHPFKGGKMQIEDNLYLVEESDIVASFTLDSEPKAALGRHDFPTSNISTQYPNG